MLPTENRLKKLTDFNLLIKNGHWLNAEPFTFKFIYLPNYEKSFPKRVIKLGEKEIENYKKQLKLAFNVGLKISKSAVKRNRLKRQMREVVRLLNKDGQLKTGYFGLLNAGPGSLSLDYAEISQKITSLLKKSGILK